MLEHQYRPPATPWISPYLTVRDATAALQFYERVFGFSTRGTTQAADGTILHAEMTWHDALIMFGPEGAYGTPSKAPLSSGIRSPVSLYVYCGDVDALYARATEAGALGLMPPAITFWGDRMCQLADLDGHIWCFATHLGE